MSEFELDNEPVLLPHPEIPVYKTPTGKIKPITGEAAESWMFPRSEYRDGSVWVEVPPNDSPWGITYHYGPATHRATWLGYFIQQYAEGRASGFPFWPVMIFSARWTAHRIGRRLGFVGRSSA